MKILHIDTNHPVLINMLNEAGFINEENYSWEKELIEKIIFNYQGVVIRSRFKIDKRFIDAAPNLKFIARVGAGLENIDIEYAEKRNITLISAPEGNSNAVGEHALGLLLALFNKLGRADLEVRSGQWNRESNRGIELAGKTVGVYGYGHMGKSFARKLEGFDCEVICYDLLDNIGDKYAKQVDLATFKEKADVVSLHLPLTPQTLGLVNEDFIISFAKPFWLLNTARGKCVNTNDLISALKKKMILGAGLDVLEFEESSFETLGRSQDFPIELQQLFQFSNVIMTPHIAGWTHESKIKLAETIANKIIEKFKSL